MLEIPEQKRQEIVSTLLSWHKQNRRVFPWREDPTPYKVFVAEFFLQRTPAERVASFFPKFLKEFPSPEKLANANRVYLEKITRSIGLKKRTSWLLESINIVCRKHEKKIPDSFEDLTMLPGVGKYTASAVLCFGFGKDIPIIDTNVIRVLTRVFGLPGNQRTPDSIVEKVAGRLIPKGCGPNYNEAMLDLAAKVCMKHPSCDACPLNHFCTYSSSI